MSMMKLLKIIKLSYKNLKRTNSIAIQLLIWTCIICGIISYFVATRQLGYYWYTSGLQYDVDNGCTMDQRTTYNKNKLDEKQWLCERILCHNNDYPGYVGCWVVGFVVEIVIGCIIGIIVLFIFLCYVCTRACREVKTAFIEANSELTNIEVQKDD